MQTMENNTIAIVVLYYKALDVTLKCMEALGKLRAPTGYNVEIVVVDNASPDDGYAVLQERYGASAHFHLIRNATNLGFAKGNNVGFAYAKETLKADFILLENSDAYIRDPDFLLKLVELYRADRFDVAGPDIVSLKDGKHQNPEKRQFYCADDVRRRLLKLKVLRTLCAVRLDVPVQRAFLRLKKVPEGGMSVTGDEKPEDLQLFGAFLIFSRAYIERYEGLYPGTFMYGEENILRYIIERDALQMRFLPELQVFHEEGSSTDGLFRQDYRKRAFRYRHSIDSFSAMLQLMQADAARQIPTADKQK